MLSFAPMDEPVTPVLEGAGPGTARDCGGRCLEEAQPGEKLQTHLSTAAV